VGTPRWLQRLVFVVDRAISLVAIEKVLKAVHICDVGSRSRLELGEFVGGMGGRVK